MIATIKNNRQIALHILTLSDYKDLVIYLQQLNPATQQRFGPHPYDISSVESLYSSPVYLRYIARDIETNQITAYAIVKKGFLQHDADRLLSFGIIPNQQTDCTFAPSVADTWQNTGVGTALFNCILTDLKQAGFKRILLWGGVQADNQAAVHYYKKTGFQIAGDFEYNGHNHDMFFMIS